MSKQRIAVLVLSMSAAGVATWQASEGYTDHAVIPTKGDRPTIGHGSTRYENGQPVRMGDTITPPRARELARNLIQQDCKRMSDSLRGVKLYQEEYDVYCNFVGQFGMDNWQGSSMQKRLLAGDYVGACDALLLYKYSAGYDCSTPGNKRCYGVWTRQLERNRQCLEAQ